MSSYAELVVDRSINDGWSTFRSRLTDLLESDGFDGLQLRPPAVSGRRAKHWVWTDRSGGRLVVQARVGKGTRRVLGELGLERVDRTWFLELEPRYVDRAAHIVTTVLRDVFSVVHPTFVDAGSDNHGLWDDAADETPSPASLPELAYPNDAVGLQALVDATLQRAFGHRPAKDDDGDIPVHDDEGGYAYVSVRSGAVVEVWTVLASHIDHAKARRAIVRLSREFGLHKFQIWGDCLVASVPLLAQPFVPALLDGAISGTLYLSAHQRARVSRKVARSEPSATDRGDQ